MFRPKAIISRVTDHLYIGNYQARRVVAEVAGRREYNIGLVVDLTNEYIGNINLPPSIEELNEPLDDAPHADLISAVSRVLPFIIEAIAKEQSVLVHCYAGISRSASVVCAYLMKAENLSFDDAFDKLHRAHRIANPNHGFRSQLRMLDASKLELAPPEKNEEPRPRSKLNRGEVLKLREGIFITQELSAKEYGSFAMILSVLSDWYEMALWEPHLERESTLEYPKVPTIEKCLIMDDSPDSFNELHDMLIRGLENQDLILLRCSNDAVSDKLIYMVSRL